MTRPHDKTAAATCALAVAIAMAFLYCPSGLHAQTPPAPPTVRSLRFNGNEYIGDRSLRVAIQTSQSAFMRRTPILRWFGLGRTPRFNEPAFRRDVLRIQALYAARGFPDVVVDTVLERSNGYVDIEVNITENEPVRVSEITVIGASEIVSVNAVLQALPIAVGDPFDRLEYQSSSVIMSTILNDRGYPFATVSRRFTQDTIQKTAAITFEANAGPRATIGEIEVVGAQQIDERVILQTMTFRSGDLFNAQALYDSQLALFRTNLFTFVDVSLTDTVPPVTPPDSVVSVRVRAQVIESSLRTARLGGGYGTLDCFRSRGSIDFLNFAGGGRSLSLSGRLSQIGTGQPLGAGLEHSVCPALAAEDPDRLKLNYHLGATLREPLLFARRTSATLGVFAERHTEIRAFLRQTVRGEISVTQRVAPRIPLTLTYALSYGRTEADPATFCIFLDICRVADTRIFTESRRRSVLSVDISRNTTGSLLDPRRGTALQLRVGWASNILGSDTLLQFFRTEAEFASYHPVGIRTVFAWRVRGGVVLAPRRQLDGGDERFVPPEERFYVGGPNSVRGFSQNELGPVIRVLESIDSTGQTPDSIVRTSARGGDQLLLGNVELRFPIPFAVDGLTGSVFVDAGMLTDLGDFSLGDVKFTPGIGARLATPIGPVGLDLAVNPYTVEAGPLYRTVGPELTLEEPEYQPRHGFLGRFRLHFSVGQAF